jgi:hypothetical protein
MGAICPNQQYCGAVSCNPAGMPDVHALDIEAEMNQFLQSRLNNNWRRLVKKVQDEHQRVPSLRKLSSKQRKRYNKDRMSRYQKYSTKFANIFRKFPDGCEPYAPSKTACMPKSATCSYGLYNNVNFKTDSLTPDNIAYLLGHRPQPEYLIHPNNDELKMLK